MKKTRKSLLAGVAAVAIIAGTANMTPAAAEGPWQGFYFGADAGLGGADFSGEHGLGDTSGASADDPLGIMFGGHVGYNHQINRFVIGVEADSLFSGMDKYSPGRNLTPGSNSVTGITTSVDVLSSIRGRLGYTPHDNMLIFGTAGVAFVDANFRVWGSKGSGGFAGAIASGNVRDISLDDTGFVIGAGAEWQLDEVYSARLQGLYYIFDKRVDTSNLGLSHSTTGDFAEINNAFVITLGINVNLTKFFHGPGSP